MKSKIYLAPLRGFTTFVFRNVFSRFFRGTDLAVAPFISTVSSRCIKNSLLQDILPENNPEMPVIPQIISKDAEDFIAMAKRMGDLGYDTVNWNLGCPYPQVAKKMRGSGLLPYPDKIDAFLEKVIPAVHPLKISVKTRLGRYDAEEAAALMPLFNRYPLAEIIIHPRTGVQMYEGTPDLDIFEKWMQCSSHPIVYNGDIRSAEDFRRLSERFPRAERWMIGRGLLSNPFLAEEIRTAGGEWPEKRANSFGNPPLAVFRDFHNALFAEYRPVFSGTHHLVERMIGYWHYFADAFAENRKFIKNIRKCRKAEDYLDTVGRFLETEARWKA